MSRVSAIRVRTDLGLQGQASCAASQEKPGWGFDLLS